MRVALVQMNSKDEKAENLEKGEMLIAQAAAWGSDLVVLPELWTYLGPRKRHAEVAEPIPGGETTEFLARLATRYGFWLVGGSILEAVEGQDRVHNTSVVINPDGELVARYRKLHLFDVEVEGTSYQESSTMAPGEDVVVASLAGVPVGLTVCYDLRFPALYRALASAGADFIAVPAAFTKQTGEAHWRVLVRARAIETGAYVLAACQGGLHENGRSTYGHSMVVSPWGEVLAEAGENPQILLADIDLGLCAETRAKIPSLRHGREFEVEIVGAKPRREAS